MLYFAYYAIYLGLNFINIATQCHLWDLVRLIKMIIFYSLLLVLNLNYMHYYTKLK